MTRRTTQMRVLELARKQPIQDIILDTFKQEYGHLTRASERLGLSSSSVLTRWIDQLDLQNEIYRIKIGFGLAVPQNWSSHAKSNDMMKIDRTSIEDKCLDDRCKMLFSYLVYPYLSGIWTTSQDEFIIEVTETNLRHRFKLNIGVILSETNTKADDVYKSHDAHKVA